MIIAMWLGYAAGYVFYRMRRLWRQSWTPEPPVIGATEDWSPMAEIAQVGPPVWDEGAQLRLHLDDLQRQWQAELDGIENSALAFLGARSDDVPTRVIVLPTGVA